jgi:hypothetical protein
VSLTFAIFTFLNAWAVALFLAFPFSIEMPEKQEGMDYVAAPKKIHWKKTGDHRHRHRRHVHAYACNRHQKRHCSGTKHGVISCHPGLEPGSRAQIEILSLGLWIPAFAGMTNKNKWSFF